ncbi:MAG: acyltransferase [Isosphaeraceae bacterium]|nr:acyltransferase [Isosphaeraceae bacterium]
MRRIPELDAVRGLAALAIVVYHIWIPWCGFLATSVDLFFVLSGYLITTIIILQQDRPGFLRVFYARRALRIWPIYYVALLALVVANTFLPGPDSIAAWPYYLTYTQRLPCYWFGSEPSFPEGFRHTWTLAIEEQFYIVWPLLLVRFGRRALVPTALAMIAVAVSARSAGFAPWILLTRCDGLALGGLLAWLLARENGQVAETWVFAAVGLSGVAYLLLAAVLPGLLIATPFLSSALALSHFGPRMLAINLLYFGLVGCLVRGSGARWLVPLRLRALSALGQMSYGVYLYHYIILYFVILVGVWSRLGHWWAGLVTLAASLGVSALSWRYVERPLLALKDRFGYESRPSRPEEFQPALRESLRYEGS